MFSVFEDGTEGSAAEEATGCSTGKRAGKQPQRLRGLSQTDINRRRKAPAPVEKIEKISKTRLSAAIARLAAIGVEPGGYGGSTSELQSRTTGGELEMPGPPTGAAVDIGSRKGVPTTSERVAVDAAPRDSSTTSSDAGTVVGNSSCSNCAPAVSILRQYVGEHPQTTPCTHPQLQSAVISCCCHSFRLPASLCRRTQLHWLSDAWPAAPSDIFWPDASECATVTEGRLRDQLVGLTRKLKDTREQRDAALHELAVFRRGEARVAPESGFADATFRDPTDLRRR